MKSLSKEGREPGPSRLQGAAHTAKDHDGHGGCGFSGTLTEL